jgi:hypothetical protein
VFAVRGREEILFWTDYDATRWMLMSECFLPGMVSDFPSRWEKPGK